MSRDVTRRDRAQLAENCVTRVEFTQGDTVTVAGKRAGPRSMVTIFSGSFLFVTICAWDLKDGRALHLRCREATE
jgi:hypothetical protein